MSDESTEARLEELHAFKERFPGVEVQEYCQRRLIAIRDIFGEPSWPEELLKLATEWLGKDKITLDGKSVPRDHDAHIARAECASELTAWVRRMTPEKNVPRGGK